MKIKLNKIKDLSDTNLKKFEDSIKNNNTFVLIHSEYCGHCVNMRSEFEKFKKNTKANVFEIEGGVLDNLKEKNPRLYNRVTKKDLYFPYISSFSKNKKKEYKGERSAHKFEEFIS